MNHYTIKYENDEAFNNILYRNGWMHWLPMTEDAVFEDGAIYLLCDVDGSYGLADWDKKRQCFFASWKEPINPKYITHYARITEPNK